MVNGSPTQQQWFLRQCRSVLYWFTLDYRKDSVMSEITIHLPQPVLERLRSLAQDQHTPIEQVVQSALLHYVGWEIESSILATPEGLLALDPLSLGTWKSTPSFINREDYYFEV